MVDAVADGIHIPQLVDLSATQTVAGDEEDGTGLLFYISPLFLLFKREEISTTFTTAFGIRQLRHGDAIYYTSTAVE